MGRTKGSGQGSIYKRGDKWRGQISVNGQRLSYTSAKKKDVIDWMSKIRMDDMNGLIRPKSNITVQELCDYWIENVKGPTIAPQTLDRLETSLRCHLYPVLGKYRVQDLTREVIENAYPKMFKGEYSDGTIETFSSYFKMLLKYAVRENILAINPHDDVIIQKRRNKKKVDAYTEEDQRKLVAYIKSQPPTSFNALIYLLLSSGMRIGEASALTLGDIDLESGAIDITKTIVRIRGHISVQDHPKTSASVRTIFLSESVMKYMRQFLSCKEVMIDTDWVFVNMRGNLFSSNNMHRRWIRTCAAADIPYKGLHSLRHTFATRALEKGIDIKTVSSILGHKNVVTTMNIYQDVYSARKLEVAEIMDDLF